MESHNLSMLNCSLQCTGEVTWCRGTQQSVIDYVLANECMYNKLQDMRIDEERQKFDLSDHNLIEVKFEVGPARAESFNNARWREDTFFSCEEDKLERFIEEMEMALSQQTVETVNDFNGLMLRIRDNTLKKVYRRKIKPKEGGHDVIEPPWMTNELRREIKHRKALNQQKRRYKSEEERKYSELKYVQQKRKVQQMIREEMHKHEDKIVKEIKDGSQRGKKMWMHIARLRKTKDKNDGGEI